MNTEIKVSAKTVEEALLKAATELGVTADEIEYTVTAEAKKGFLGIGAVDAEIVAKYKDKNAVSKDGHLLSKGEKNAVEFIETVIADMGIKAEIGTRTGDNGALIIEVAGDDSGVLIGHHGETLDALQYLAGLAANRREIGENGERAEKGEYVKVALDIAGYREKREETLRNLARERAARVLKYKRSVMLEPMNPYERRIIHSEIQGIEGVSTTSIGSDSNRKIVIFLENKSADEKESD